VFNMPLSVCVLEGGGEGRGCVGRHHTSTRVQGIPAVACGATRRAGVCDAPAAVLAPPLQGSLLCTLTCCCLLIHSR
jgi:hypothetical protein